MAVPKTTETRCRDGSVQARQVIKDYTSNPIPMCFFLLEIVTSSSCLKDSQRKARCTHLTATWTW